MLSADKETQATKTQVARPIACLRYRIRASRCLIMPNRASRPCSKPGCGGLVEPPVKYCSQHKDLERSAEQQHDRWRGTAASRGYDHQWRATREARLRHDKYLCQPCLTSGRVTPAIDVHHKVPIRVDPSRRLDLSNLISVCRPCHKHLELQAER